MSDNDKMDERRKQKANEIITHMHDNNASPQDIQAQKKSNKQSFGHEGAYTPLRFVRSNGERCHDGTRQTHQAAEAGQRCEEQTSELQFLMRIPYAVLCLQ